MKGFDLLSHTTNHTSEIIVYRNVDMILHLRLANTTLTH